MKKLVVTLVVVVTIILSCHKPDYPCHTCQWQSWMDGKIWVNNDKYNKPFEVCNPDTVKYLVNYHWSGANLALTCKCW